MNETKKYVAWHYCNIYDSEIGDGTQIGSYSEIKGAKVGKNCRIQPYCFIPERCVVGDNCFIGPRVTLLNDKYPTALNAINKSWVCSPVTIESYVTIGGGVVILPGVRIGYKAVVGAGSVVTKNVKPYEVVYGNPATVRGSSEGSMFDVPL